MYNNNQESNHIREAQQMLYVISMYNLEVSGVIPDGIYGSETANSVRSFQQYYGLQVNGEINTATWVKITEIYHSYSDAAPIPIRAFPTEPGTVLHKGEGCFSIWIAQAILLGLSEQYENIPPCHVTGILDMETHLALQPFQKLCTLPVTGCIDCTTWNMLAQAGSNLL